MDEELEQIKNNLQDIRESLYKLLDKKLDEHSMNYYIREKGIGSKSIQELKYNRDKLLISTLINNLQKMT